MHEQEIFSGPGSLEKTKIILKKANPGRIFLLTGRDSFNSSGAADRIAAVLKDYAYLRFYDFQLNPRHEDIQKGLKLFNKEGCDFILAIGGGTVLDTAKAISQLANQDGDDIIPFIKGEKTAAEAKIPLVAIPTTAGTGSESTHFSVVYINKKKYSFAHPAQLPDHVILDPSLTMSLSSYLTACTGMDALSQAIESFWSIHSTQQSREYSREAMKLLLANLESCVKKPEIEAREKLLLASNLAGKAINIAKTTAAHALSYPLTSYYNVPHGHAVALTLPSFIEFNYLITPGDNQDERGSRYVKQIMYELIELLDAETPTEGRKKITFLLQKIGLETQLGGLGLGRKDVKLLIREGGSPQRLGNNPRRVTEEDIERIYEELL
ncbi:phosphonoacetaldehyde reductase [Candidatus Riflebacteria bacterium]